MNWELFTAATSSSFGCHNATRRGSTGLAGAGVDPTLVSAAMTPGEMLLRPG